MFVDASALIAIITEESDGEALARQLQESASPITSPLAIYEAVLGVKRKTKGDMATACRDVTFLLDAAKLRVVPVDPDDAVRALDAFDRYGKGTGHPAGLNMGDCFAYAVAKSRGVRLLYKGSDFAQTDLG